MRRTVGLMLLLALVSGLPGQDSRAGSAALERVRISLAPASGGATVIHAKTPIVLELEGRGAGSGTCALELWLPPEARIQGLPDRVELPELGKRAQWRGELLVEEDRPCGPLELAVVLKTADSGARVARREFCWHTALGRDFVRLSF